MKIMFLEMANNMKELLRILAEFFNMFGIKSSNFRSKYQEQETVQTKIINNKQRQIRLVSSCTHSEVI